MKHAARRGSPASAAPPVAAPAAVAASEAAASPAMPLRRVRIFVFTGGVTLMALEIVGSRVLAPWFGNTIFTWGSLITVFMAALSLGYYVGGRLADRYPSALSLAVVGWVSAALILLVPPLSRVVCESIVRVHYGPRTDPFLAAVSLFFLPSVVLGMISPFAVRIASYDLRSIGKTAGTLYALSTLGSIIGTILTSFYLIPALGVRAILLLLAGVMTLVALLLSSAGVRRVLPLAAVVLLGFALNVSFRESPRYAGKVVFEKESHYQNVYVVDREGDRYLYFDKQLESGIELKDPWPTVCHYTDMLHLGFIFCGRPRDILVIGGGGAIAPRRFRQDLPQARIDVVEIDPVVVDVSRRFFHFQEDGDLRTHVADGRMFLARTDRAYDLIVLDAYSISGQVPFHLMTEEFFRLVKSRLKPDGAVLMNLISAVRGRNSALLHAEMKTLARVFPHVYSFPRGYPEADLTWAANIMLVATARGSALSADDIVARAQALQENGTVTIPNFTALSRQYMDYAAEKFPDVAAAPTLTDDFAPVELLQPRF